MERNRVIGMVAGYYLSRLDSEAYRRLAMGNKEQTHRAIGKALRVPHESVRNWRDEFDPIHENSRQGWHKREMRASRASAADRLSVLSDEALFELVQGALADPAGGGGERVIELVGNVEWAD